MVKAKNNKYKRNTVQNQMIFLFYFVLLRRVTVTVAIAHKPRFMFDIHVGLHATCLHT